MIAAARETGRSGALEALSRLGMIDLARRVHAGRVLILAYHGLCRARSAASPWTMIALADFEEQAAYLARHYQVLPLSAIVQAFRERRPLPARTAAITFDDGYRNNLELALPVLERHRLPATVFITAGFIGRPELLHFDRLYLAIVGARGRDEYVVDGLDVAPLRLTSASERGGSFSRAVAVFKRLSPPVRERILARLEDELPGDDSWRATMGEELRILSRGEIGSLTAGGLVEIGAHTMTHPILATIDRDEAEREIGGSKQILERITGKPVALFAYPNGRPDDYAADHVGILRALGFQGAVTTVPTLNAASADVFSLGRICVGPELAADPARFRAKVSGLTGALKGLLGSNDPSH